MPEQVGELSQFLARGFGTRADSGPLAVDVLRWKYFDHRGQDLSPRSFVVQSDGRIVGHVGISPTLFITGPELGDAIPTLHMMDWLGSASHPGVGASLMRHVQRLTPTQYACGASAAAHRVLDASRFIRLGDVPIFRLILRAGYRIRSAEKPSIRGLAGTVLDAARMVMKRGRAAQARVRLREVDSFGVEVEDLARSLATPTIFTSKASALLNHFLRHPSGEFAGFLILEAEVVCGFALLNVVQDRACRIGKIVECFLDDRSGDLWTEAIGALVELLSDRGADVAFGCGSTERSANAYRRNGFTETYGMEFRLRDRAGLIPRDRPFHLTYLEADYAYLP